jgi:O-antigen ligase
MVNPLVRKVSTKRDPGTQRLAEVAGGSKQHSKRRMNSVEGTGRRLVRLVDRLIFGALLGLIVVCSIVYGAVEPSWEAVFECTVFGLAGLWALKGLVLQDWAVSRPSLLFPLVLLAIFGLIQTVILPDYALLTRIGILDAASHALSIDPYQTQLTVLKLLAYTFFLGLLLSSTSSPKRLRWLLHIVVVLGFGSALFGIARQTMQKTDGFLLDYLPVGFGYGQFIYRNAFAYLMEMALALTLGLVVSRGVKRNRLLLYLAPAIMIWMALVLSNSRGAILGLITQVTFLSLIFMGTYFAPSDGADDGGISGYLRRFAGSYLARGLAIVLVTMALCVGVLWTGGERLVERFQSPETAAAQNEANVERLQLWRFTGQLVKDHPITGVGFGAYWLAISQYQVSSGQALAYQAHNDYLDLLASGGFIAVVLAAWFLFSLIRAVRPGLGSHDAFRRGACIGAIAGLLDIGVHSFIDFGLQITSIAMVFCVLITIAVADHRVEKDVRQRVHEEP